MVWVEFFILSKLCALPLVITGRIQWTLLLSFSLLSHTFTFLPVCRYLNSHATSILVYLNDNVQSFKFASSMATHTGIWNCILGVMTFSAAQQALLNNIHKGFSNSNKQFIIFDVILFDVNFSLVQVYCSQPKHHHFHLPFITLVNNLNIVINNR